MGENHTARSNPWEDPFALSRVWYPPLIAAVLAETLVYGMHVILFVVGSSVLLQKGGRMQIISFFAVTVMFILSTADVGFSFHAVLNQTDEILAGDSLTFLTMVYPKFLIHLINNLIADVLLIVRCYMIWGESRTLLYGSGLTLLAGTAIGFVSEGTPTPKFKTLVAPYILIIVVLNVTLTLTTAWRIWWIGREVGRVMGRRTHREFSVVAGILLETGSIYTGAMLLVFVLAGTKYVVVGATIAIRTVCIMPIFLVVQVALGRGTKDLSTSVSEARSRSNDVQLTTGVDFQTSISQDVAAESRNIH